jgi:hypothetical protein
MIEAMHEEGRRMEHQNKKSRKLAWVGLLVVIMIAAVFFVSRTARGGAVATLYIESGEVQYLSDGGWLEASEGMELSVEDTVRTVDGEATIIFSNTAIMSLEPNTEVSIREASQDKVSVGQNSGSTWNKFLGLTGITQFEVETPSTVATVRGTEFGIDIIEPDSEEGYESVLVAEGEVMFGLKEEPPSARMKALKGEKLVMARTLQETMAAGKEIGEKAEGTVKDIALRRAEARKEIIRRIEKRELTAEDKEKMVKGVVRTIDKMKVLRRERLEQDPELKRKLIALQEKVPEGLQQAVKERIGERLEAAAGAGEGWEKLGIDEKLDRLAAIDPAMMERLEGLPERIREGGISREDVQTLIEIGQARREKGMEKIDEMNGKIMEQLKLLEELQGSDKEMGDTVKKVLQEPRFRKVIEPIADAQEKTTEQMIRSKLIKEEEIQKAEQGRMEKLREALRQQAAEKEMQQRTEEEMMRKEQLYKTAIPPQESKDPVMIRTPEGEFLKFPDGRIEPMPIEKAPALDPYQREIYEIQKPQPEPIEPIR